MGIMKRPDLGTILKEARLKKGLSQLDVAEHLKLHSAQSVSDWERGYGSGVPLPSLKQLIKLYDLSTDLVFEALLEYQYQKLEKSLTEEFYARPARTKKR